MWMMFAATATGVVAWTVCEPRDGERAYQQYDAKVIVAAWTNVKSMLWPDPSGQVPPDGGSSAQLYEHGVEAQVDAEPSKCTL